MLFWLIADWQFRRWFLRESSRFINKISKRYKWESQSPKSDATETKAKRKYLFLHIKWNMPSKFWLSGWLFGCRFDTFPVRSQSSMNLHTELALIWAFAVDINQMLKGINRWIRESAPFVPFKLADRQSKCVCGSELGGFPLTTLLKWTWISEGHPNDLPTSDT